LRTIEPIPCRRIVLVNRPVGWFICGMKSVGIFEAKTHLAQLCDEVQRSGVPVVVSRRGKPLALLAPVGKPTESGRSDIHSAWKAWKADRRLPEFPDVAGLRAGSKPSVFGGE
jgi:prevent-host-death family protein